MVARDLLHCGPGNEFQRGFKSAFLEANALRNRPRRIIRFIRSGGHRGIRVLAAVALALFCRTQQAAK